MRKILLSIFCAGLTACAANNSPVPTEPDHAALARQGIAPHVWEEPMVDVIDVPPGLDPEGHYYRPAHQSIVEIRQGRWQHYREKEEQQ